MLISYFFWLLNIKKSSEMGKVTQLLSAALLALGGVSAADDASVLTSEIGRQNNESLFWGPYKPNLYFGVRPRTPEALWSGLMWGRVDGYQDIQKGIAPLGGADLTAPKLIEFQDSDIPVSKQRISMDMAGMSMTHAMVAFSLSMMKGTKSTSPRLL